jgi:hypothetical protein
LCCFSRDEHFYNEWWKIRDFCVDNLILNHAGVTESTFVSVMRLLRNFDRNLSTVIFMENWSSSRLYCDCLSDNWLFLKHTMQ